MLSFSLTWQDCIYYEIVADELHAVVGLVDVPWDSYFWVAVVGMQLRDVISTGSTYKISPGLRKNQVFSSVSMLRLECCSNYVFGVFNDGGTSL